MRKAQMGTNTQAFMIGMVLALLLAFVYFFVLGKSGDLAGSSSKTHLQNLQKSCKERTEQLGKFTSQIVDEDNDRYADICDLCLGSNNNLDNDGDGMPNGCERPGAEDDSSEFECRFGMNPLGTRCNVVS